VVAVLVTVCTVGPVGPLFFLNISSTRSRKV
jgi:hypothetical protein